MNNEIFSKNTPLKVVSYIILLLAVVIVVLPLIFVVITSLKDNADFYTNLFGLPKKLRFDNFANAWKIGKLGSYFMNSIIVTVSSVAMTTVLAILGGYALGKLNIPKANLIMSAFMMFSFIPGIAIYISLYTMMNKMNLTSSYLTLILPYAAWQIPFSMFIIKQYFETIPEDLIESGRIDGCSEFKIFLNIMLPLIVPAIATIVVFNFVSNWGELMWANIATAASVQIKTLPVGLLNFKTEMGVNWGQYCAGITIVTVPLMAVFAYFQKYFIAGLTNGAVKG